MQVHKIFSHGLAALEGTIEKGDEVLSINGQTLKNVKHSEATAALRQARELKQAVVVVCKNKEAESSIDANTTEASCSIGSEHSVTGTIQLHTINYSVCCPYYFYLFQIISLCKGLYIIISVIFSIIANKLYDIKARSYHFLLWQMRVETS